jgi:hypothetical protein
MSKLNWRGKRTANSFWSRTADFAGHYFVLKRSEYDEAEFNYNILLA